jgi:hypothetical protein
MTTPIERLKSVVAARTPGKWASYRLNLGHGNFTDYHVGPNPGHELTEADALGIEAMQNVIDELIAVAEAARDVYLFTLPEWENDVDRGDADEALIEAYKKLDQKISEVLGER